MYDNLKQTVNLFGLFLKINFFLTINIIRKVFYVLVKMHLLEVVDIIILKKSSVKIQLNNIFIKMIHNLEKIVVNVHARGCQSKSF